MKTLNNDSHTQVKDFFSVLNDFLTMSKNCSFFDMIWVENSPNADKYWPKTVNSEKLTVKSGRILAIVSVTFDIVSVTRAIVSVTQALA